MNGGTRAAVIGLAIAVLAAIGVGWLEIQRAADSQAVDVRICVAQNQLRRESNHRAIQGNRTGRVLEGLLKTITRTRRAELAASRDFPPPFDQRLGAVYRRAARADARLLKLQRSVRYDRLPLLDCRRLAAR